MRKVELQTSEGAYVAVADIPPFPDERMPGVIVWGERCFVPTVPQTYRFGAAVYVEAFAYHIAPEVRP